MLNSCQNCGDCLIECKQRSPVVIHHWLTHSHSQTEDPLLWLASGSGFSQMSRNHKVHAWQPMNEPQSTLCLFREYQISSARKHGQSRCLKHHKTLDGAKDHIDCRQNNPIISAWNLKTRLVLQVLFNQRATNISIINWVFLFLAHMIDCHIYPDKVHHCCTVTHSTESWASLKVWGGEVAEPLVSCLRFADQPVQTFLSCNNIQQVWWKSAFW